MFTQLTRKLMQKALRGFFQSLMRLASEDSHLEVERKFRIAETEVAAIRTRLSELLFKHCGDVTLADTFLPATVKGEMMRVRRETCNGHRNVLLTYKTWVATDDGGKERQEAEHPTRPLIASLLILLGRLIQGEPLLGFSKERALYRGAYGPGDVVVSIDQVVGLGRFSGYYVEIEIMVPHADQDSAGAAKSAIYELAGEIFGEAREDVKQSYLDMLIASRAEHETVVV